MCCFLDLSVCFSILMGLCRVSEIIPDSRSRAAYFGPRKDSTTNDRSSEDLTTEGESLEEKEQPRRCAEVPEMVHIASLAVKGLEKHWVGPFGAALEGQLVNSIFFSSFVCNVPEDRVTTVQLYVFLLAPFNCDLASSLQKLHPVAFRSYHETCTSTRERKTPPVQTSQ